MNKAIVKLSILVLGLVSISLLALGDMPNGAGRKSTAIGMGAIAVNNFWRSSHKIQQIAKNKVGE